MTQQLAKLRPGAKMLVSAPHRTLDPAFVPDVMVAGGSAVTIGIQVCKAVCEKHPDKHFELILCNTTEKDVVNESLFNDMLDKYPNFELTHCISQAPLRKGCSGRAKWYKSRIAAHLVRPLSAELRVIVSGPIGLGTAMWKMWNNLHRPAADIKFLDQVALEDMQAMDTVEPTPDKKCDIVEILDIEEAPPQIVIAT